MMHPRMLLRTSLHTVLFIAAALLVALNLAASSIAVFDGGGEDGGGGGGGLPPTASLSANPSSITAGNGSVLSWSSLRAYQCDGTGFSTGGLTSGSVTVYPSTTTTYSVFCYGNNGTNVGASATVTVSAANPAPTVSLSASPSSITSGGSSTLTWSSTNATSCSKNFGSGTATSGSNSVSPTSNTTYTVACTGAGGSGSASATVTVSAAPVTWVLVEDTHVREFGSCPPYPSSTRPGSCGGGVSAGQSCSPAGDACRQFYNVGCHEYMRTYCCGGSCGTYAPTAILTANPTSVVSGQSSTLSYACTDSTSASINQGVGSLSPVTSGTRTVSPTANTTYTLTCTGAGGSTISSATVTFVSETSSPWVNMGCGLISDSYNASCNPTAEWRDIECMAGEMLQGRSIYGEPACKAPNNPFRDERRCVVDASCPVTPDLTATTGSAQSGTTGASITLSGTITNLGTGGTVSSFPNILQICNSPDCLTYNTNASLSVTAGPLGAGASVPVSRSATLPSTAGSYMYRYCADVDATFSSTIPESNEGNNCGAWTSITVSNPVAQCQDGRNNDSDGWTDYPADPGCTSGTDTTENPNPECSDGRNNDGDAWTDYPADPGCTSITDTTENPNPPTATFSCTNPAGCVISPGGSATLTWSTTGYTNCVGVGFSTGAGNPANGSASVSSAVTTSYGLTCDSVSIPPATVTVRQPYAYIEAVPDRVNAGQTASIRYSASQVTTCSVTGTDGYSANPVPDASLNIATTSVNRTINRQTTYTISCDGGAASSRVIVNTTPQFKEF